MSDYKRETSRERKSAKVLRRFWRPKTKAAPKIEMPELLMPGRKSREWAGSKA
jgi:hypothetical protein